MISKGADVKFKYEKNGITALHMAASICNKELVDLLISKGADVNSKDNTGTTPLHYALGCSPKGGLDSLKEGWKEVAELLLAKGADINAQGYYWWTPLHFAVKNNSKEAVELLLSKGADVNLKDIDDRTPLYYAGKAGNKEIEKLLLSKGAKPLN
jgi:cytohesin